MKFVADKQTIVLAGAFNPAILTPQWLARNALGYADARQFQVEMHAPVVGIGGMPRFTFDGISYAPNFQAVSFFLAGLDTAGRQRVTETIGKVLELLPHTPMTGLGFNFGFEVEQPAAEMMDYLRANTAMAEALPNGAEIVARSWANTFSWQGALVTYQCSLQGTNVSVDANFHYGVARAEEAQRILQEQNSYAKHFDAAVAVASALTRQQLEDA